MPRAVTTLILPLEKKSKEQWFEHFKVFREVSPAMNPSDDTCFASSERFKYSAVGGNLHKEI